MLKQWHISEGVYFEEMSGDIFSLTCEPDEISMCFEASEIDDIIDALRMVMAHYRAKETIRAEKEKLARWGKAKIPTKD